MSVHSQDVPVGQHRRPEAEHQPVEVDFTLTAQIAVEVQSCALVAGLHGGPYGAIATDAVEGRLVGVRVDGTAIVVGVVSRQPATTDSVVDQVRAAVLTHAPAALVTVSVVAHHDPRSDALTIPEPRSDEQ